MHRPHSSSSPPLFHVPSPVFCFSGPGFFYAYPPVFPSHFPLLSRICLCVRAPETNSPELQHAPYSLTKQPTLYTPGYHPRTPNSVPACPKTEPWVFGPAPGISSCPLPAVPPLAPAPTHLAWLSALRPVPGPGLSPRFLEMLPRFSMSSLRPHMLSALLPIRLLMFQTRPQLLLPSLLLRDFALAPPLAPGFQLLCSSRLPRSHPAPPLHRALPPHLCACVDAP